MSFYSKEAQAKVSAAVAAVEEVTAAEIVVAVRARAGDYGAIDLGFGAAAAFLTLLVLLFYPRSFSVAAMPVDVLIVFGLGALVCRRTPALRRLFIRRPHTLTAARAAFVELGVSQTRGRTGVLIFVAKLERDVAIVRDLNAPEISATELRAAVRRDDVDAFVAALLALRPTLQAALPRAAADVDELANAPTFS